jgi:hypothetical protein
VNAVPRPIPEKKWFMEPLTIILLGGILPFGSIFIEMYFIFTSFWAYKIYYVYGFMLLGEKNTLVPVYCSSGGNLKTLLISCLVRYPNIFPLLFVCPGFVGVLPVSVFFINFKLKIIPAPIQALSFPDIFY